MNMLIYASAWAVHYYRFFRVSLALSQFFLLAHVVLAFTAATFESFVLSFVAGVLGVLNHVCEQYASYGAREHAKRQRLYDNIMEGAAFASVAFDLQQAKGGAVARSYSYSEWQEEVDSVEEEQESELTTASTSEEEQEEASVKDFQAAAKQVSRGFKMYSRLVVQYSNKARRREAGRSFAMNSDRGTLISNVLESVSNMLAGASAILAFAAAIFTMQQLSFIAGGIGTAALLCMQVSLLTDTLAKQALGTYKELLKMDVQNRPDLSAADKKKVAKRRAMNRFRSKFGLRRRGRSDSDTLSS